MYYKIVVPGPEPGTYLSCHGGTHTWTPGITYGPVPVEPCHSGFHACRAYDLSLWLIAGMVVFEVELTGVVETPDKVVGSTATLGRCLGTLTPEGMAEFARRCAERAKEYAAANADAAADARDPALAANAFAADADAAYAAANADARAAALAANADAAANAAASAARAAYYAAHAGRAVVRATKATERAERAAAADAAVREQQGADILSLLVAYIGFPEGDPTVG